MSGPLGGLTRSIENVGRSVLGVGGIFKEIMYTFVQGLAGTIRGQRAKGDVVNQMYIIGNKSLLFVAVTLGAIGMVMVFQSCLQISNITGDLSQVGREFLKLLIQEFGPTLTALMLATRVGAGIAAEIGSMKVTEQIDALRMSGITPIDYLIAPRIIATFIMSYTLTIFGIVAAFAAGGLVAWKAYDVNPRTFFDISRVGAFDCILGAIKTGAYALATPVVSGTFGLTAKNSSEGVGAATTQAVIGSSLAVIILNFIISGVGLFFVEGK